MTQPMTPRERALIRCGNECEGRPSGKACGFVAWNKTLEAQLETRERDDDPKSLLILCPKCTARHDRLHAQRAS